MNGEPTLLVVDDEASNLESLERIFAREGLTVLAAKDGKDALEVVRKRRIDVVLTDLMMPGISGVDLLKAVKQLSPETETVVMTAYGTVEAAVEAMREGAYDFITKPLKRAHVVRVVAKALEKQSLMVENRRCKAQLEATRRRPIVGQSLAMRRTLEVVQQAAPSMATVLLLGESGTGKELLARQIHESSPRAGARLRAGQLRRHPRGHPRGRAVRLREGRLHRRGRAPRRTLRARRRRHALPRRDRRDPAQRAGQAPARPAGGRDRAPRRQVAEDRHPPRRRDQQGSAHAPSPTGASARTSTIASTSSR